MASYDSYLKIKNHLDLIAKDYGRDPKEITLIAVSKNNPWDSIHPAYEAGCRDFGENQVKEALEKIEHAPKEISWHLIGTLQSNKIKKVLGKFQLIHSVDSLALAEKISFYSNQLGLLTHILLQVNTSGEKTKHGLSEKECLQGYSRICSLPNIVVEGLMTIAPQTDSHQIIRESFKRLRLLKEELNSRFPENSQLVHLSMGMTNDYPIAIEQSATLLRIGSAIFGERIR